MEGKEKVVERESGSKKKEEELLLKGKEKWKRSVIFVGKKGGPSTPAPTWRLEFSSPDDVDKCNKSNPAQEFLNTNNTSVSARKLCASLWEVQPQLLHLPVSEMSKNVGSSRRAPHDHNHKGKRVALLGDSHNSLPYQPESARSLRRHVATPLMQHRRSLEGNVHSLQPLSPARHGSSMEVAPYNPAITPTSSMDVNGKMGESSYSLKTSAELLKVLNRIWSLEAQQESNISSLKALKMKLDHSRLQIKELVKEKETNRQEMDDLLKHVAEDKVIRRNKEKNRIKAAVESVQEELEDERKLRKHSESLHRRLARELSEVKSSFSNALKELDRERKARILLENLCDEFAKGIREYEQEVRSLRQKPEMDYMGKETPDRLVLHISEAWLDERMQMKLSVAKNDPAEKNTIVDKLSLDIETFLQARHSVGFTRERNLSATEAIKNNSRRESFPINEAGSAPHDAVDEEDSLDEESGHFELNNATGRKKQTIGSYKRQGDNASKSRLEEVVNSNPVKKMPGSGSLENSKGVHAFSSNNVIDKLMRNHSLSSEGDRIHPVDETCVEPVFPGHASPVQRWMLKLASPEFEKSKSSSKLPCDLKEDTLRAKLLEARLESQKSRTRASKASL